jgi:hypothetical protein
VADVHVLFEGSVEEHIVDIKLTKFNISCGRNGEEEAEAGHANDWRVCFRIVEASALATAFGDKPGFEAGDIAHGVGLTL